MSKSTTSDYHQLDVRRCQRNGWLEPGRFFTLTWSRGDEVLGSISVRSELGRVILSYRHSMSGDSWKNEDYPVSIEWTRCHYGGARAWFRCPASGCGRRVAVLYGGGIFACRHCYRLAYDSQREPAHSRALRRAQAIRERLDGSGGMADDFLCKPKGMHWRTYERLCAQAEEAESRSWPPWLLRSLGGRPG
jgi:hypothetical protein